MKKIIFISILLILIPYLKPGFALSKFDFCLTENTDKNNMEFAKKEGVFVNAWVKVDNAKAFDCFKDQNKKVKESLKIRYRYRVVANNYKQKDSTNREWTLLVKGGGDKVSKDNIVGWVCDDDLLSDKTPLKNSNSIYQKVLIKKGDMDTENGENTGLSIFGCPELNKYEEKGIQVRTVFYVYDYYPHGAGSPQSEDTKSLLISPVSHLDFYSDTDPLLLGWIDRSKVTFWNTRIGYDFPIKSSVDLLDENDKNRVIATFDKNYEPLPYDSLKNPILKEQDDYYLVGAFTKLGTKTLIQRKRIEKITTGLEVLFVIDGTRSMSKVFKQVLEGVEDIAGYIEHMSNVNNLKKLRFGLVFYRDKPTHSPVMIQNRNTVYADHPDCKKETSIYKMSSIKRFKKILNEQIACDSDDSLDESVYSGLIKGLEEADFDKGKKGLATRVRVIIHIGDAGDNGRGNFTGKDVAYELEKHKIYSYISIDVSNKDNSSFKKSIDPIVDNFENAGFIEAKKDFNLSKLISRALVHFVGEAQKIKTQIEIISRGFAGTSQGRAGVVSDDILNLAKDTIEANNIDLTNYDAFQNYFEGRIHKNTKLNKYVLVSRNDIENITFFLSQLIDTPEKKEKRQETWEGLLNLILGEETCTSSNGTALSLEECNKMRNGIPIKAGFMKYTIEEFINLDNETAKQVKCQAKMARERFRLIISDQKPGDILYRNKKDCDFEIFPNFDINEDGQVVKEGNVYIQNPKTGRLQVLKEAKDSDLIDKYFFKEGGESVAWIPLEHLGDIEE